MNRFRVYVRVPWWRLRKVRGEDVLDVLEKALNMLNVEYEIWCGRRRKSFIVDVETDMNPPTFKSRLRQCIKLAALMLKKPNTATLQISIYFPKGD